MIRSLLDANHIVKLFLRHYTSFLDSYKFDEITLRIFGEVAIVTGRLSGQIQESDGTHDINQRYMRVYVKRNERWQAVATQVTRVKETVLS